DIPSIGCARKRLVGQYSEPDINAGSYNILSHKNIDCGYVYRSRTKVKPIFISPGHKCGLEDSFEIIKNCIGNYRMPQPLRIAHLYASKFRRVNERRNQKYCDTNNNRNFKEKILSR
ncbi:MAG: hypothetical protein GY865_20430, partial [candidate division Zixibacteria bacterium]|nr:hypothetical protein [candidate division Zixibacteria bacterium]